MKINSNLDWDKTLKFYSGYSRDDLKNVKTRLVELAHTANNTPDKKPLGKTRVRFGTPKNEEASSSFTESALSKFNSRIDRSYRHSDMASDLYQV